MLALYLLLQLVQLELGAPVLASALTSTSAPPLNTEGLKDIPTPNQQLLPCQENTLVTSALIKKNWASESIYTNL